MATYLVTGGAGFIGSHLADALRLRDDTVRILDDLSTGHRDNLPSQTSLVVGGVADPPAVAGIAAGVDGIFHLAAVASVERGNQDWLGTHRTNLSGTITVLDAARRARTDRPVPVVYASSAAVFGANEAVPLTEDAATQPLSAYGADKLGCEQHAFVAGHVHAVPTCGLRFFNVYGPRQAADSPYAGVISIFARRLAARQRLPIHGDGTQLRDFVHVSDAVRHLRAAMRLLKATPMAAVANVCTGRGTTILDLAHLLGRILGRVPEFDHLPPREGDIRTSLGDPDRARALLGIAATMSLADGLARMLAADAQAAA